MSGKPEYQEIYNTISVGAKYRRKLETKKGYSPLINKAAAFMAVRKQLAQSAPTGHEDLPGLVEKALGLHSDLVLEIQKVVTKAGIRENETKAEITRMLEVVCDDHDILIAALDVLEDPSSSEESLRILLRRGPAEYLQDETAESFAGRSLRLQLRLAEPMVLRSVLGLVDRAALCLYPENKDRRAAAVPYVVGSANVVLSGGVAQ